MQLPKTLDPIKLGKLNAEMQCEFLLQNMPRLQEISEQADAIVKIHLQFGQDERRTYFINGKIKTKINLICQRCNKPMQYEMDAEFALSPVVSDERAKNLSERYEPVAMENECVSAIDMIEDEILLALPMVPKHDSDVC
ncbi:MAG: YceD family protein [Gammaproteobacteria bacterium]|nr:YceD family protein [Gammaproteobacteria bacterium]